MLPSGSTAAWCLNGANNAQGMMDFLLWWFGPNNKANGEQIATVAAKPAYHIYLR
ncbi:MAG: hypothetical protein R2911_10835 [Caldilineaceae bacterium]